MTLNCPKNCVSRKDSCPDFTPVVRFGSFFRASDSRRISRFRCKICGFAFSTATLDPCFKQQKRRVNEPLRLLLASGVSMRRAGRILNVRYSTVARKLRFLAILERKNHSEYLETLRKSPLGYVHFDEMETFEHTKMKPLSLPLVVHPIDRKILGVGVARMPAKGLLAERSRKKYGSREDQRAFVIGELLSGLKACLKPEADILSDENPHYPGLLRRHIPRANHFTTKGRRGCVVGQGELKRGGHDPLFALNHTCAMIRANVNRLFRRTWCTTKKPERLLDHLWIYIGHHNRVLTAA